MDSTQLSASPVRHCLSLFALALAACGEHPPVLVAIEIIPAAPAVARGSVVQLVAKARYSDGFTEDAPRRVTWSSLTPSVAEVSASGLVSGVAIGTSEITATVGQRTERVVVTVGPPVPVLMVVTPSLVEVAPGHTASFRADQYVMSDFTLAPVVGPVVWSSTDEAVASVDAAGLAQALNLGTTSIRATQGALVGLATLKVAVPVPVSIRVTPSPVDVALGLTTTFRADHYVMSDSTFAPVVGPVTWSSTNEAVATVDAAGLAQSLSQGTTSIRATQGLLTGEARLAVGPPAPVSIAITPSSVVLFPGRSQRFTVAETLTDRTTRDVTTTATWSSSDPSSVSMEGALVWSENRNPATIMASIDGLSDTATVNVLQGRIAFATSSHGNADLGSWNYGVGKTGLAAADAICQSSARAGRLPGTYRAWLSDASDDAYCRMHQLGGTLAARCGQDVLPASAGPWMRTDGVPYAARIDRMVSGEIYTPPSLDEYGNSSYGWLIYTGSDYAGGRLVDAYYTDCGAWTSAAASPVAAGVYDHSTSFGLGFGTVTCGQNARLFCLEMASGEGPALPARNAVGKLVFMTSVRGPGMLAAWADAGSSTGLAAGDAVCRARAAAAGFPNASRYRAWLSDATTDAIDRLTSEGPWVRPDGVLVAASKAELVSGYLFSSISVTETGRYVNWNPGVSVPWDWSLHAWTGTTQQGMAGTAHCASWTAAVGATATWGATNNTVNWSDLIGMGPSPCTELRALYCFED